jgi:hypothetical protein
LSVQIWYAMKLSESQDDFEDLETFFSLTVDTLNSWRRAQNFRRINGIDKDANPSAKSDIPSPVVSSTPPISSPAYVAPAPVVSSFCSNIKINISDYPKLKEDSQWRAFNCQLRETAANHDTLDILYPNFVPSTEQKDAFEQKQKFMYNVFTNIILTSKGKVCVRA